ncbi:MAG: TetR/AcrR family transcriptional regulator [Lachnospiraceae bacterium]|nr:TetR/AcrR family transcriptional regulator [Lachnospiraceae bacterium]
MLVKPAFERLAPERRKKLLDTAILLYLEQPYDQITIRMLVDRLQINMNTFYRYFESKDDLFLYIYRSIVFRLLPFYDADRLLEGFQELPEGVLSEIEERFAGLASIPDDLMHRMYFEVKEELEAVYRKALEQKKERGLLWEDVDIDLLACMYVTTGYNLLMYWKEKTHGRPISDPQGNVDPEWKRMKEYFYYHFFNYGILRRTKDENTDRAG